MQPRSNPYATLARNQQAPARDNPYSALAKRQRQAPEDTRPASTLSKVGAALAGIAAAPKAVMRQTTANLMGIGKTEEEKRQIQAAADVFGAAETPRRTTLRPAFETARAVTSVPLEIGKYAAVSAIPGAGLPLAMALGAAEAAGGQAETSAPAMLSRGAEKVGMPRAARALGAVSESPIGRALFDVVAGEALSRGIQGAARTAKQVRGLGKVKVSLDESAAIGTPRPMQVPLIVPSVADAMGLPGSRVPVSRRLPARAGLPEGATLTPSTGVGPQMTAPIARPERTQVLLPPTPPSPRLLSAGAIPQPASWRVEQLRQQGAPQSIIDAIRSVEAQQAAQAAQAATPAGVRSAKAAARAEEQAAASAKRAEELAAKRAARKAESEARKAAKAAETAAARAAAPRGRKAMATPEELAAIPDRLAEDSPVHPDGSWKLTFEELSDPQRMDALGARRRLPKTLTHLTDRELEIAAMRRTEELGNTQAALARDEHIFQYEEDSSTGRPVSKSNPRLLGSDISRKEARALGGQMSEEMLARLEDLNMTVKQYRELKAEARIARLRETALKAQLARIEEEVARRRSGAPPAPVEAPQPRPKPTAVEPGVWWTQPFKQWTEMSMSGKLVLRPQFRRNLKELDEAGLQRAAEALDAKIEELWTAGKQKQVEKFLRPVERAINDEFEARGLLGQGEEAAPQRAMPLEATQPEAPKPPAQPPTPPPAPPQTGPALGEGGYPADWDLPVVAVGTGLGQGGLGAAAGAAGADEGERMENALLYGLGAAGAGVAGMRALRALRARAPGQPLGQVARQMARQATGSLSERLSAALGRGTTMPAATPRATPLTEAIDPESYVNIPRFSADPVVQDRIRAAAAKAVEEVNIPLRTTAADVAAGRAKKVGDLREQESLESVRQKVAEELNLDPADIVTRAKDGKPLDRFDLLTIRNALVDATAEEDAILKRLADKNNPPLAAEIDELRGRYARVSGERNALFEALSIGRTQQGRDLNALKIAARQTFDPLVWEARLTELAKRPLTEAEKVDLRRATDTQDQGELFRLAQVVREATTKEKFVALFKAGMLSAPRTYLSNAFGNLAMAGMETVKEVPAAFFDTVLGAFTGQRSKYFNPRAILSASKKGAISGVEDARRVLRGEVPRNMQTDLPREINFDSRILDLYTKRVFRSLSATDQFFRNMAIARSIDEQARVLARAEGLKGEAFTARVAELVERPTDAMSGRAIADAEIATFQDDGTLAQAALTARRGLNRVTGGVGGDLLFPFAKTPANIAQRIIDYSPAGGAIQLGKIVQLSLSKGGSAELAKAQRQIVEQLGRASLGTAALYAGYALAKEGMMTGFFPDNQRERDGWEQQGKVEGAIKIGQNSPWIQVNKYSPVGNLMQIGAQMHSLEVNPRVDLFDYSVGTATAPFKAVAELPMVANVNDLIKAFQAAGGPETAESLTQVAGRFAGGLVPGSGLLRAVAAGTDPYTRETRGATAGETIRQQVQAAIPGVSRSLPMRVDPLGRPQERYFGLLGSLFSPSQVREDLTRQDPVRAELARTGAVVGRIERQRTETGEQYAKREQLVGRAIGRHLQNVMRDPEYQAIERMDVRQARQMLEEYVAQMEPVERIDLSKIGDDRIRARLQGLVLQQQAARVKSAITRATSSARGTPSSRRAIESILR